MNGFCGKIIVFSLSACVVSGCFPQREGPESTPKKPISEAPDPESGEGQGEEPGQNPQDGGPVSEQTDSGVLTAPTTAQVYENFLPVCVACHGSGQSFPIFASLQEFETSIVRDEDWVVAGQPEQSALLKILEGFGEGTYAQMPPGGEAYAALSSSDESLLRMQDLSAWVENLEEAAPTERSCWDAPGFKGLQRLTRTEYNNTVRDLLDDAERPGDTFPADDYSHGFDNIAEVLTLSPLLVEKYELAAQTLVENAITYEEAAQIDIIEEAEDLIGTQGAASGSAWNLWSNGVLSFVFSVATEGDYTLSFRGGGQQAGTDFVRVNLLANNQIVASVEVVESWPQASVYSATVHLLPGTHSFGLEFTNDYWCPQDRFDQGLCDGVGDRNFLADWLRVEGPQNAVLTDRPAIFETLVPCEPEGAWGDGAQVQSTFSACASSIFATFGRKAWRRPLTTDELDRLTELAQSAWGEGDTFIQGIELGYKALLLSPNFIFKVETEPAGATPSHRALTAHELATRLSYFLWSSTPDDHLLDLADSEELLDPDVLRSEVTRMLADAKAEALTSNFAAQWLLLRDVWNIDPEYTLYPDFDEELRDAMYQESTLLFQHVLDNDLPLTELLSADYSFVNQRLANHYGIAGTFAGRTFQQVTDLPNRSGFLTHAGWLALTSNRTRTSPVKRGKWVLERLLCESPPPPPPGVEGLVDDETIDQSLSIRERMEQHRADPNCAACHLDMDAVGFAFENFDAIGAYRTEDGEHAIDPSGSLLGQHDFADGQELAGLLAQLPEVSHCMTEKMLTYALGRALYEEEVCLHEGVLEPAQEAGFTPTALIQELVTSPLFQQRKNTEISDEEANP